MFALIQDWFYALNAEQRSKLSEAAQEHPSLASGLSYALGWIRRQIFESSLLGESTVTQLQLSATELAGFSSEQLSLFIPWLSLLSRYHDNPEVTQQAIYLRSEMLLVINERLECELLALRQRHSDPNEIAALLVQLSNADIKHNQLIDQLADYRSQCDGKDLKIAALEQEIINLKVSLHQLKQRHEPVGVQRALAKIPGLGNK